MNENTVVISVLEKEIEKLEGVNKGLLNRVKELKADMHRHNNDISMNNDKISTLQSHIYGLGGNK